MRSAAAALLIAACAYGDPVVTEDQALWAEIDGINLILDASVSLDADSLVETFRRTVEVALSCRLSDQFEDLRTDAFMDEDYSAFEAYADRAAPAITVLYMGESNSIGVNTGSFLERCESGTAAFEFFETAGSGFYADGEATVNGTARLSAWEERTGSSCEAAADPVPAAIPEPSRNPSGRAVKAV